MSLLGRSAAGRRTAPAGFLQAPDGIVKELAILKLGAGSDSPAQHGTKIELLGDGVGEARLAASGRSRHQQRPAQMNRRIHRQPHRLTFRPQSSIAGSRQAEDLTAKAVALLGAEAWILLQPLSVLLPVGRFNHLESTLLLGLRLQKAPPGWGFRPEILPAALQPQLLPFGPGEIGEKIPGRGSFPGAGAGAGHGWSGGGAWREADAMVVPASA